MNTLSLHGIYRFTLILVSSTTRVRSSPHFHRNLNAHSHLSARQPVHALSPLQQRRHYVHSRQDRSFQNKPSIWTSTFGRFAGAVKSVRSSWEFSVAGPGAINSAGRSAMLSGLSSPQLYFSCSPRVHGLDLLRPSSSVFRHELPAPIS